MSTTKKAVKFLDSEVNAIPGTCHIIMRYLTAFDGSSRQEIREHLEPGSLVGGVQAETGAFAHSLTLLRNLRIINEENGSFSTSIKLFSKTDGSPDFEQFQREVSRAIVDDSIEAILDGGEPSDLVKLLLYFSTTGIEESFESVVGAADVVKQRFGYQDLNQEKWNSLKRWMSSLGLSRSQLSGSINFDPSEFILSIATTFESNTQFKFGEFAELIGDGMPSLVNPILRNWFRSQNSIINRDSYMDFSECLVWSVEALEHTGRFKIELLDDDSRENIFNLRNRQVSAITFKNPGDNHE